MILFAVLILESLSPVLSFTNEYRMEHKKQQKIEWYKKFSAEKTRTGLMLCFKYKEIHPETRI